MSLSYSIQNQEQQQCYEDDTSQQQQGYPDDVQIDQQQPQGQPNLTDTSYQDQQQTKLKVQYPDFNQQQYDSQPEQEKIEYQLQCLNLDLQYMFPVSFEKIVIRLLYYVLLKLARNPSLKIPNNPIPKLNQLDNLIKSDLQALNTNFNNQKSYYYDFTQYIKQISDFINDSKWSNAENLLQEILQKIRPLNIHEINRLIEKTKVAENKIKQKDVILLLGLTGSGKSTTIHFLSGSKMFKKDYEVAPGKKIKYISAEGNPNIPELKNVTIGPQAKSETRHITVVTTPYKEIEMIQQGCMFLVDTNGFGDGKEIDIANAIGIVEALKGCNNVRPVILISYQDMMDHIQGLKNLLLIIVNMFENIQANLHTLVYAFSKFPTDVDIHAYLLNIRNHLDSNLKDDKKFIKLFDDILLKTQNKDDIIRIDPLTQKPKQIINKILPYDTINNPRETFKVFITQPSKLILQAQLNQIKNFIAFATKQDDYEQIEYKLQELKLFKENINLSSVKQDYTTCQQQVIQSINQKYALTEKQLIDLIQTQDELSENSVKLFDEAIKKIKISQKINEKYLNGQAAQSNRLIQTILDKFDEKVKQLESIDVDNSLIKNNLNNIQSISNIFSKVKPHYQKACQYMQNKLNEQFEQQEELIRKNQFRDAGLAISKLKKLVESLKVHIDVTEIQQNQKSSYKQILSNLEELAKQAKTLLHPDLQYENCNQIGEIINKLKLAIDTGELNDHVPNDKIKEIYTSLMQAVNNYFNQAQNQVQGLLKKVDSIKFSSIQIIVNKMVLLRKNQEIETLTSQIYNQIIDDVSGEIQYVINDAQVFLRELNNSSENLDFNRIYKCLDILYNAQWIDDIKPETCKNLMQNINEALKKYFESLKTKIMSQKISKGNIDNLLNVKIILENLEDIKKFEKYIPEFGDSTEKIISKYNNEIQKILDDISNNFNSVNTNSNSNIKSNSKGTLIELENTLNQLQGVRNTYKSLSAQEIGKNSSKENVAPNEIQQNQANNQQYQIQQEIKGIQDELKILKEKNNQYIQINKKQLTNTLSKLQEKQILQNGGFENYEQLKNKIEKLEKLEQDKKDKLNQVQMNNNQAVIVTKPKNIVNTSEAEKYQNFQEIESKIRQTQGQIDQLKKKEENIGQYQYDYYHDKQNDYFDVESAEKSLIFAEKCIQIHLLEDKANAALNNLKDYLRNYNQQINKEFQGCLSIITNPLPFQINDIQNNAKKLLLIMKHQKALEKYPAVHDLVNPKKNLETLCMQLNFTYIALLGDKYDLKLKLEIAQSLINFEQFTDKNFQVLHSQFQNQLKYENKEKFNEFQICIKEENFRDFVDLYLEISEQVEYQDNKKILDKIRKQLSNKLSDITLRAKQNLGMLGNNLSTKIIQSIAKDIYKIQFIRDDPNDCLDDYKKQCLLDDLTEIGNFIEQKITNGIQNIKNLLRENDFWEAKEKIDHLIDIRGILASFCQNQFKKVIDKIDNSENIFSHSIETAIVAYEQKPFEEYETNPPIYFLMKLQKIAPLNPSYNGKILKLKQFFLSKGRALLEKAKIEYPNKYSQELLETRLYTLPEDIQSRLKSELEQHKKFVDSKQNEYKRQYEGFKLAKDSRSILQLIEKCSRNNMREYCDEIKEDLLKQAREYKSRINEALSNDNLRSALGIYKEFVQFFVDFGNQINGVSDIFRDVSELFTNTFNKLFAFIASIESTENTELVETNFDYMISLEKKNQEYNTNELKFLKEEQTFLKKEQQKLMKCLSNSQQQYKKSLVDCNIQLLRDTMDNTKKWSKLLQKIKMYCDQEIPGSLLKKYLKEAISNYKFYQDMQSEVKEYLNENKMNILNFELVKGIQKQREEKYKQLEKNICLLQQAKKELRNHFPPEIYEIYEKECQPELKNKFNEYTQNAIRIIEKPRLKREECDEFCMYLDNLKSYEQNVKNSGINIKRMIEDSERKVLDKISQIHSQADQPNIQNQQLASYLIEMKTLAECINPLKMKIDQQIDNILKIYRTRKAGDGMAIPILSNLLEKDLSGIGLTIISEHSCFKGQAISLFNQETQKYGIDLILEKLNGELLDKIKLKKHCDQFNLEYNKLVKEYITRLETGEQLLSDVLRELIATIKVLVEDVKHPPHQIKWDSKVQLLIPKLVAHIFAYWTIKNTNYYTEMRGADNSDRSNYLLKPHAGQILSIFRMLGLGYTNEKIQNNLIQIGTGEGKSVILGVTSVTLALLGINVSCACYSEYLSQRDHQSFLPIFQDLGVAEYISYGTFNKLCEQIINESGNIRDRVISLINNTSEKDNLKIIPSTRPRILLIDEVDVFFSQDFYGNVYTPQAKLKDPLITALINYIWQNSSKDLSLGHITETKEYIDCRKRFNGWETLINETIKDMLVDVKNYKHDYLVQDDKIVYKEQDSISSNISYGYKTLFAYYYENQQGNISKESLNNNIGIGIYCGHFSYKDIPHKFQYIIGVSGTLKTLSEPEKNIVQNVYKINIYTFMPSVFGENKRIFAKNHDLCVENKDDYYKKIVEQIRFRLVRGTQKRAILVFFENDSKLLDFYESDEFATQKPNTQIINEELSRQEKEQLINRASTSGQITLLTRVFGRGTDFICRDQTVITNGGVHVMQTFLSEEISEEIQIMGRCARQGQDGSFSMVLLDQDLEGYLGSDYVKAIQEIRKNNNFYEILEQKRQQAFAKKYKELEQQVQNAEKEHHQAMKFIDSLNNNQRDFMREFLVQQNKGPDSQICSSIILAMDATGTMKPLLDNVKQILGDMFNRISTILKGEGLPENCYQIQLVAYRDYDCKINGLLQVSPWENKSEKLTQFMNTVKAYGGDDIPEAVEVALQHANKELKYFEGKKSIFLIADAPSKTSNEVQAYRKNPKFGGETYWNSSKFSVATDFQTEIKILKDSNIPVHAYYLHDRAKDNFQQIAKFTDGKSAFLDIHSPKANDVLANVITEQILSSVAEAKGINGNQLVQAYREQFKKCYQ